MNIVYTKHARNDLHEIYEYIAFSLLSPENASSTVKRITDAVRSLESMPERNPVYKDEPWKSKGVRFATARNYMIFYTVNTAAETVSISRIMYGGRDISRQFENV